jgi:energy-converting hydrogenase Eha subunit E
MSSTAQQSRVDALVRLVGLIVFAFGVALIYYTYTNAADSGFAPQLVPVYYFLGLILLVAGAVGAFAKFK